MLGLVRVVGTHVVLSKLTWKPFLQRSTTQRLAMHDTSWTPGMAVQSIPVGSAGSKGIPQPPPVVLLIINECSRIAEKGKAGVIRTAPQVLCHVDTLIIELRATPKTAGAPAMWACCVPPLRVTFGPLRAAVWEVSTYTVAHSIRVFADAGIRVAWRIGRESILAFEVARVHVTDGYRVIRIVALLVITSFIDLNDLVSIRNPFR